MSYQDAISKQLKLLSESRNFYSAYNHSLGNLQHKEEELIIALEKLAVAKRSLQNIQIDIIETDYFTIPGTIQKINEHMQKLYENRDHFVQNVKKYDTLVKILLKQPIYIESKQNVEKMQVQLKYYQSQGLFR